MKSEIALPRKSLRPPQFGLRTLLLLVAACGALLALTQWLPPMAVGAIAFLAVSIFCHVAGNAIGTRLREIGSQPDATAEQTSNVRGRPRQQDFAPTTRLGERQTLGWTIIIATSIGIASGAIGGGLWTFFSGHGQIGLVNIAVGVIAFAILGGMAAFATIGFAQVLFGAIWQASKQGP